MTTHLRFSLLMKLRIYAMEYLWGIIPFDRRLLSFDCLYSPICFEDIVSVGFTHVQEIHH